MVLTGLAYAALAVFTVALIVVLGVTIALMYQIFLEIRAEITHLPPAQQRPDRRTR